MGNINVVDYNEASPEAREVLDKIKKKLGKVPNIYAAMVTSPTALKAILSFKEVLDGGVFTPKETEAIALVIAQENECRYCLAAHTAIAKMVGVIEEETFDFRKSESSDLKIRALTNLAKEIIRTRGRPSEKYVDEFLNVGYDQKALVELIAHVSINIFTNYFNNIAETPLDFPKVLEVV